MKENNIIAAISTPAGIGGIAIIRLSGNGCIELVDAVFKSFKAKKLAEAKAYTVHFGSIIKENVVLDDVLVSVFRNPHSFTGEDIIEISCHGSIYIQQNILQLLISKGASLAQPGEFTQRAFLNGKMDLSQAESVADLIASSSAATHRLAMNQIRGGFSNKLIELRTELLNFTSLIELELDFSEEDVEFANRDHLKEAAHQIESHIKKLADSFSIGNAVKSGIPVAIIGETNAGKSTLLNLLLHEEKAIVSDIHGTTRDVIEDTINIQGLTFRLIDTAGIRDTHDEIESLGIERTFKKIEQANIVLWVADCETINEHIEELSQKILPVVGDRKLILIFNKVDIISAERKAEKEKLLLDKIPERVFISAKYEQGTNQLEDLLVKTANIPEISEQDIIVTNVRHYEALQNALVAIKRVSEGLDLKISGDFLSQDIRECMYYLGEITGQISTDEILGNIFSKFCIGK
ncbi:MAG: tRNA uridine-5-carboxymethylaminomethyl(34) synthesis GTPase MnmE [Dysgonomonas mossii]|uniref:tRNA uridine-5-carboxymethylaminomethyl(34) synthesis GTPase MnmE n=1 Tax=Dysgonomonas mossii TaxID=163665 RepID=UPI001E05616D|nr:tRNA uridine-5-carboxymethylaminomethyl(34) synthesis GTPase MnmE [Dysgonomonas mossii]MBS5797586.1 tRNA uridine-5-carboxymethylaminomethyl(34) synthesis GTPase MnmE [Dysgonomonas mossii]MBS7111465.1 tRNA uridine-5-carboxymethylaminomethyl(34) synthesis GTPase MnmE [Dysgonomonas mossii]